MPGQQESAQADHSPWSVRAGVSTAAGGKFSGHRGIWDRGGLTETHVLLCSLPRTQSCR